MLIGSADYSIIDPGREWVSSLMVMLAVPTITSPPFLLKSSFPSPCSSSAKSSPFSGNDSATTDFCSYSVSLSEELTLFKTLDGVTIGSLLWGITKLWPALMPTKELPMMLLFMLSLAWTRAACSFLAWCWSYLLRMLIYSSWEFIIV